MSFSYTPSASTGSSSNPTAAFWSVFTASDGVAPTGVVAAAGISQIQAIQVPW